MTTKKGIALPINMLVILAVAVIVLLAVVAFFMGSFETGTVDEQTVLNECCGQVVRYGECHVDNWHNLTAFDIESDEEANVTVGGETFDCTDDIEISDPSQCPACQ